MSITDKTVLVTGANRGLGRALVDEALARGAKRVYAGTRGPLTHADQRVTPLPLDVTSPEQIEAAAHRVLSLDLLINNAGVANYADINDLASFDAQLAVNLFGTYRVTQAFIPLLTASGGAVVNIASLSAIAAVPVMPGYSISKAAVFSLSQSARALLKGQGVRVHAVLSGPIDTDMTRALDIPKSAPESVAHAILDGVDKGEEEIFPDVLSASVAEGWYGGVAKALERQNAALLDGAVAP